MNCCRIILAVLLFILLFNGSCTKTKTLPPKLRDTLRAENEHHKAEVLKNEQPNSSSESTSLHQDKSSLAEPNKYDRLRKVSLESKPTAEYAVRYVKLDWTISQCYSCRERCIAAERQDVEKRNRSLSLI